MFDNKVIVFGGSHHNTLGVIRSLGEKGIKTNVVICSSNKKSFVLKSKYLESGIILNTNDECYNYIVNNFTDKINKSIIICTSDATISCIDLHYDSLISDFFIPNASKQGLITKLMDKNLMRQKAEEAGLKTPLSWSIKNSVIPDDVQYPCITKPTNSIIGTKNDIVICKNKDALYQFILKNHPLDEVIVQRYIDKEFEYQLIGCSYDRGNNLIIPGYTKIIRSSHVTNTGFLEYLPFDEFKYPRSECFNFIKSCMYSGLFSLEFLRGKDGLDYFLEINFRNDGNAYSVTGAGVNLPYLWVASCVNLNIEDEKQIIDKGILVMPELVDIFQVIRGNISLAKWLKDVKRTNCFLLYNKFDKKPFYYELKNLLILAITKLFKKMIQ